MEISFAEIYIDLFKEKIKISCRKMTLNINFNVDGFYFFFFTYNEFNAKRKKKKIPAVFLKKKIKFIFSSWLVCLRLFWVSLFLEGSSAVSFLP